jgi:hypothetical protein
MLDCAGSRKAFDFSDRAARLCHLETLHRLSEPLGHEVVDAKPSLHCVIRVKEFKA